MADLLPTGHTLSLAYSDSARPPGQVGGMHVNDSRLWMRLTRGDEDTGWCRAVEGSAVKVRAWWLLVESEADVREAWAGTVDAPLPR